MRILILNWRDVRSPRAGGAEVFTYEVARRLAESHEVSWFTSRPDGLPEHEVLDGVRVVRKGTEVTTRLEARAFAATRPWDVVVEEINTLPYLSPLWSRSPVVLLINQLAREVWWYEAPLPLAAVGYAVEPLYLRAYRDVPAVTISRSTRDDLVGLGHVAAVDVVPMGVVEPPLAELSPKRPTGRLLIVGRLAPSKRVIHAVRALPVLQRFMPSATLTIVGDGRDRGRLERETADLGVAGAVTFTGAVSASSKTELMRQHDLLVACAAREGWGLTVTEAARQGTPAVAYDAPGLRDAIVDGRTGLLSAHAPEALALKAQELLRDEAVYQRIRAAAWAAASPLSWDATAVGFERALERAALNGR
jgi:glycosyltransferase involved in cell wall biosynthesis